MNRMNDKDIYFASLKNIGAGDGRHCLITYPLRECFSEHALHKYRTLVQIKHLIKMSEFPGFRLPKLADADKKALMQIFEQFDDSSSQAISEYDHFGRKGIGPSEHDVKSVELFLKEKLKGTKYEYLVSMIHFGFTSEDVNNIAYNCMLKHIVDEVWLPKLVEICRKLREFAVVHKKTPLLSRTHGQPASPTTFGKEMALFLKRLVNEIEDLKSIRLSSKMNGAVGNYNAHVVSFPNIDWIIYSKEFVGSFGFDVELLTNQRGPKNRIVKLLQAVMRINNIIKDLDIDLWLYVSRDLVLQTPVGSHAGSSVMPHKINPWLIECSEGNVEVSNALFEVFCREVEISRLQRDLSDHDLERNYGISFAYSLVALSYTNDFLSRISVNSALMLQELRENPKILSEAYQTILRAEGMPDAYDIFKDLFRSNESFDKKKIDIAIDSLRINDKIKSRLKSIKAEEYLGHVERLVDIAVESFDCLKL